MEEENQNQTVSKEEYDSLMNKFNDLLTVATNLTKQIEDNQTKKEEPKKKDEEPKKDAFLEWYKNF